MITPGLTLEDARRKLAAAFAEHHLDSPQADARLLLSHVTKLTPTDLVLHHARLLTAKEADDLTLLASRRINREPIARILGEQEFFGLTFRLTPACLVPRPDSEVLVEAALALCPQDRGTLLDLGTGPGTLLLAFLSRKPGWRGIGIDLSAEACATAKANAERLGLSDRATIIHGSWTTPVSSTFDCILTNPPYIPTADCQDLDPEVRNHDPRLALDGGTDGLSAYRDLAREIPAKLVTGGLLFVEAGLGQAEAITRLFVEQGLTFKAIRHDLAGIARCVIFADGPA